MSTATLSPPRPKPPRHRAGRPRHRPADRPPWVRPALSSCWSAPQCCTCGTCRPPATRTSTTPPPSRRARSAQGLAVRLPRLRQRDHGGQAARSALGDDGLGAALRVLLVEPPAAAGADGRRLGRDCSYGAVRRWAGPVAGLVAGAALALTPVGSAHVPVRQPGRAGSTPPLVAGGLCRGPAIDAALGAGVDVGGRRGGHGRGLRLPQRRWGRRCSVVPAFGLGVPRGGPTRLRTRLLQLGARSARWSPPRAGTSRWWSCGPPPTGRTSAAPPPTPCWSSRWATTGSAGSSAGAATRRRRPRWRRRTPRSAGRPGSRGCSPARSRWRFLAAARRAGAAGRRPGGHAARPPD